MFWLWIAGAAASNHLEAAGVMAIVMSVLLLTTSIGLVVMDPGGENTLAHMSLALVPAVVAFACVALYVRHLRQQTAVEYPLDWVGIIRKGAATPLRKSSAEASPLVAGTSGDGPRLPVGANDHEMPAASDGRDGTQAARRRLNGS
jgi:hypothetical protein